MNIPSRIDDESWYALKKIFLLIKSFIGYISEGLLIEVLD